MPPVPLILTGNIAGNIIICQRCKLLTMINVPVAEILALMQVTHEKWRLFIFTNSMEQRLWYANSKLR
jgi:hypothetical protein